MFPLGSLPDPHDARDYKAGSFLSRKAAGLAGAGLTGSALGAQDYRAILAAIRNQRGNACVGATNVGVVDAQARYMGVTPAWYGSEQALYGLARQIVAGPDAPLRDEGSIPREAIKAMRRWGIVSEALWNPDDVNERLPVDVLHEGAAFPVSTYHRVDGLEDEVIEQLCSALDLGFFPSFVMPVDDPYMRLSDDRVYGGTTGALKGWHDQMLCGYELRVAEPFFWVRGSWGKDFAAEGYAKISARWIASTACRDRWVLDTITIPT